MSTLVGSHVKAPPRSIGVEWRGPFTQFPKSPSPTDIYPSLCSSSKPFHLFAPSPFTLQLEEYFPATILQSNPNWHQNKSWGTLFTVRACQQWREIVLGERRSSPRPWFSSCYLDVNNQPRHISGRRLTWKRSPYPGKRCFPRLGGCRLSSAWSNDAQHLPGAGPQRLRYSVEEEQ